MGVCSSSVAVTHSIIHETDYVSPLMARLIAVAMALEIDIADFYVPSRNIDPRVEHEYEPGPLANLSDLGLGIVNTRGEPSSSTTSWDLGAHLRQNAQWPASDVQLEGLKHVQTKLARVRPRVGKIVHFLDDAEEVRLDALRRAQADNIASQCPVPLSPVLPFERAPVKPFSPQVSATKVQALSPSHSSSHSRGELSIAVNAVEGGSLSTLPASSPVHIPPLHSVKAPSQAFLLASAQASQKRKAQNGPPPTPNSSAQEGGGWDLAKNDAGQVPLSPWIPFERAPVKPFSPQVSATKVQALSPSHSSSHSRGELSIAVNAVEGGSLSTLPASSPVHIPPLHM